MTKSAMTDQTPSGQQAVKKRMLEIMPYGHMGAMAADWERFYARIKDLEAENEALRAAVTAAPTAPSTAYPLAVTTEMLEAAKEGFHDADENNCDLDDCWGAALTAALGTAPSTAAGDKTSAVKQMERSPERWANMSPDVVADGSRAQVAYALKDAQHDIALLVAALATPPAPSVPWEEQAAQIRREALEEAALVIQVRADEVQRNAEKYPIHSSWLSERACAYRVAADMIRALAASQEQRRG